MAYVTIDQAKSYQGISLPDDDSLLTDLLTRAQSQIENHCRRKFEASTQTRFYSIYYPRFAGGGDGLGRAPYILYLDEDLLSVTTLTNANTVVIPSSGYWLEPRNVGPPYDTIRLKVNPTTVFVFNTDGEVSVAGSWGYSTGAPPDIQQATVRLASYLYHQRGAQIFETTAQPDMGVITVPVGLPVDVQKLLSPYRRQLYG